jgi:hypothetical protein
MGISWPIVEIYHRIFLFYCEIASGNLAIAIARTYKSPIRADGLTYDFPWRFIIFRRRYGAG